MKFLSVISPILEVFFSVFWIRDTANRSGSCSFRQGTSRCQQKFFSYYFLKVHLNHSSQIKSGRSVFLQFFSWWWEDPDPDSHLWLTDPDLHTEGPKTCGFCGSGSRTLLFLRSFIPTNLKPVLVLNQIDPCCVVPVGNLHFNHIDLVLTAALLWVKRWHVISLFESSPPLSLTHKCLVQHLKWGS